MNQLDLLYSLMSQVLPRGLIHEPSKESYYVVFHHILSSENFTQQQGAKFYFVYIPDFKLKNYKKIIKIVKNLDIPIIDIYKELHLTLEDPMALYPFGLKDQHYNELGYRLIAETILNKIDEYDRLEKE